MSWSARELAPLPSPPLEQGILTDKYLDGFPADSRAIKDGRYLQKGKITDKLIGKVRRLNDIAKRRNQTMDQLAISWLFKDDHKAMDPYYYAHLELTECDYVQRTYRAWPPYLL
jgi:aryl-alcohol dehydrogenase-like predicted oxidoreductase